MNLVCVIPGPSVEVKRWPDRVRWCFKCRKRLMHFVVVLEDERQPSYYEPIAVLRCAGCDESHTEFPSG